MTLKPKLAYIIHGISVGGAELAFLSALPSLYKRYNLRVYVLGGSNQELIKHLDAKIIRRIKFYDFATYAMPFYLPFLYTTIRSFKPDVIISSLWRAAVVSLIYKYLHRNVKYFILLHSSHYFHWADRCFTKQGMQASDAIFADSQATEQFAKRILRKEANTRVLSYLVSPLPTEMPQHRFAAEKDFFFVGRLNQVKQVPLAVKAISELRAKGIDARLHIYGRDDGDQTNVEKEVHDHGLQQYVVFEGEVSPEEKHKVFASYDYYIQLSAQEGMAMSVAEAMQHGAVCIVTPVGGIAQYAHDGYSAIFVDTVSEQAWHDSMEKIVEVLGDPERCETISRAAFNTFKDTPLFADSLIDAINHYVE